MYYHNIHYRNDNSACYTHLFDICTYLVAIATYFTLSLFKITKLLVGIIYVKRYLLYFILSSLNVIYMELFAETEPQTTQQTEEGKVIKGYSKLVMIKDKIDLFIKKRSIRYKGY